jgi:hypothetical protein
MVQGNVSPLVFNLKSDSSSVLRKDGDGLLSVIKEAVCVSARLALQMNILRTTTGAVLREVGSSRCHRKGKEENPKGKIEFNLHGPNKQNKGAAESRKTSSLFIFMTLVQREFEKDFGAKKFSEANMN